MDTCKHFETKFTGFILYLTVCKIAFFCQFNFSIEKISKIWTFQKFGLFKNKFGLFKNLDFTKLLKVDYLDTCKHCDTKLTHLTLYLTVCKIAFWGQFNFSTEIFDYSKILTFQKFWLHENLDFSKILTFGKFWLLENFDFWKILISYYHEI